MIRMLGFALASAMCAVSSAQVTNTIVQVQASTGQLDAAGFTRVGTQPFVSERAGECFVNGCFTTVGTSGSLAAKGYFQFQFNDYVYNPAYYSGVYSILDVNFGSSGMTRDTLIGMINAETATTGVTALLPSQASDAQASSYFNEWLPTSLQDAIVLRWLPNPAPSTSLGLSATFTFAWDVTGVAALGGSGLGVDGVFAVPAPGAMAIVGLAGLMGRRRR
jgi:hypothetical protein